VTIRNVGLFYLFEDIDCFVSSFSKKVVPEMQVFIPRGQVGAPQQLILSRGLFRPLARVPRTLRVFRSISQQTGVTSPVSKEEEEANKKRWEESGNSSGSVDEWRWTLNWDEVIPDKILVGTEKGGGCPRSVSVSLSPSSLGDIFRLRWTNSPCCVSFLSIESYRFVSAFS